MGSVARSEQIAVPKAAELVAEKIRSQIARGQFQPGDSLPSETELMERFGVARPTMREAIRILESEALISTRRGAPIDDLYEAQAVLEPKAARLAATRRTKSDLATLKKLVDRARGLTDVADFAPIAVEFHVALVRASKNKTLTLLVEMLHSLALELYRVRMTILRPIGEKVRMSSIELYEHVLERLEARDGAGAERVWGEERGALDAALGRLASDRGVELYRS